MSGLDIAIGLGLEAVSASCYVLYFVRMTSAEPDVGRIPWIGRPPKVRRRDSLLMFAALFSCLLGLSALHAYQHPWWFLIVLVVLAPIVIMQARHNQACRRGQV